MIRTSLRLRLTALYGGLLLIAMALVLGASYWLVGRHLGRTLPQADATAALNQLAFQYGLALLGAALLAGGVGWLFAGRQLAPMARAFEAQERFVANASHELRSPLTVIRTEAEVALADPCAGPGELREMGDGRDRGGRPDGRSPRRADGARAREPPGGARRDRRSRVGRAPPGGRERRASRCTGISRPRACAATPSCWSAWRAT